MNRRGDFFRFSFTFPREACNRRIEKKNSPRRDCGNVRVTRQGAQRSYLYYDRNFVRASSPGEIRVRPGYFVAKLNWSTSSSDGAKVSRDNCITGFREAERALLHVDIYRAPPLLSPIGIRERSKCVCAGFASLVPPPLSLVVRGERSLEETFSGNSNDRTEKSGPPDRDAPYDED